MRPMLMEELDDYSRVVTPLILAKFPDWESLAELSPPSAGERRYVTFSIPCPSRAVEHGLWVSTADGELTVGFHTHHVHFNDYSGGSGPVQIKAGLEYVSDLLGERLGVLSVYRVGRLAGSISLPLPSWGRLTELFSGTPESLTAELFVRCERFTVRGWTGRFDRDEANSPDAAERADR